MVKPATVEELEQSIRDAQERFNVGMGADGDATAVSAPEGTA